MFIEVLVRGNCSSQGRNGTAKTVGVNLFDPGPDSILIEPVTTRGPQNAWIHLDVEAMDTLAALYLYERGVLPDGVLDGLMEELENLRGSFIERSTRTA